MKKLEVAILIPIRHLTGEGVEIWMQQRQENGPLDGLWEFPGGKIERGESPKEAAIREVLEEVGLSLDEQSEGVVFFRQFPYEYEDRLILLNVFTTKLSFTPAPGSGKWFKVHFSSKSTPLLSKIPDANQEVIDELLKSLKL